MRVARLMVSIAIVAGLCLSCGPAKSKAPTFDAAGEFAKVKAARAALTTARGQLEKLRADLDALHCKEGEHDRRLRNRTGAFPAPLLPGL